MLAGPFPADTPGDSPPPQFRSWSTGRRPASCNHPRRTSGFGLTSASSFLRARKSKSTVKFTGYSGGDLRRKVLLWGTSAFRSKEISSSSLHFHKPRHISGTVAITSRRYAHDVMWPIRAQSAEWTCVSGLGELGQRLRQKRNTTLRPEAAGEGKRADLAPTTLS